MAESKGELSFKVKKSTLLIGILCVLFVVASFGVGYFASPSHSTLTITTTTTTTVKVATSVAGNFSLYPVPSSQSGFGLSLTDFILLFGMGFIVLIVVTRDR
ncbi:MAG: hypothetical protein KGI38_12460 [Thaumarchaeota archaeon]|nr:hypothetical protein [Nitrososphaerota archaeon]